MKDDAYETPGWAVHRLLEKLQLPRGGTWLEPCAGSGNIIRAVQEVYREHWGAVEIRKECQADLEQLGVKPFIEDFLAIDPKSLLHFQVLLTNPPYSLAQQYIERGLEIADHVVVLLRLNFLASEERQAFLSTHTPDIYVLPNRPSFVQAVSCTNQIHPAACPYQVFFKPSVEVPHACPLCGEPVKITSSDSAEYAWFHFWGKSLFGVTPRERGHVEILNTTPLAVRRAKTA